ncbi:MAG: tetratricopeptide repeat protein, partial [Cyanobacteria bacterium P01_F01_bin.86]
MTVIRELIDFMEIEQQFRTASQFLKEGELSQAEVQYQNILKQHPNHAYVHFCLGFIHQKRGEFAGAIESYQRAIHARPDYIEAINNLGNIYEKQGNLDEAIQCYQKTVELNPEESNGYRNLGFIYEKQRRWSNALACYKKLVDFEENFVEACYKTGRIYQQQGEFSKAIQSYQKVIQHQPDHAEALFGLGFIHQEQGQLAAAIAFYKQAIEFAPQLADAHNNLGNVLKQQGKFTEAIAAYQQALQLDPTHTFAHNSLGNALRYLGKSAQATVAFRQALQLKPNFAEAHNNLGNVLRDQGKLPEAIAAFRQALQLKSDYVVAHSNLIFTLNCSGDYEPSAIYQEHQQWAACQTAAMPRNMQPYNNNGDGDRRLRIGYVSSDFRTHSVAYFLEPLLANHDHSKFAIICYADNPKTDQTTQRLQEFADDWRDIVALNNEQLAKLIRQDQIDILVDLAGHTKGDRLRVFAYKPAPVQVSYLGYPSTTGLDTMDYRFTDAWADPEGQTEHLHTERLMRLPQGFLCYQPAPDCPDVKPSPALATGHVTFGSFNDLAKVSPHLIAHWSAILLAVPNAKMLIKARALADVGTRDDVYSLFKQQGIAADRVELLGRIPSPTEHLALYNQVDIALDTFPYNGTTTTCEALWMGVPVITVAGEAHVSRVGVSVLSVVGLPELITDSAEAYCQKAIALANDLEHLQALRETLRDRMQASPLMNAQLIAQSVEDAYRTMWQSWCGSAAATLGTQLRSAAQLLYGGELEQAALQYQSVLQQDPDHAYANFCLGCVYQKQVDFARAIACYQKAIAVKPDYIEALNNLGNIYEEQKSAKAIECYQKIVELQPHKPYTYVNLGVALRFQGKLTEAIAAYRQALQLDPNFAQTHSNLGNALNDQGKFTAAIAAYRRALELNPDFPQAYNNLLFGLNYSSDYEPTEIYHEHRQWAERQAAVYPPVTQTPGRDYDAQRRLRIGYVSGDLKTHSVAYFMEPLLAAHDHDKFEIICYANNTQTDKTTQRLQQLADGWRDISPLSHEQVVALIQQDQIDILIDLSGHTKGNRLPVFACQPAPVQISYLGYPNTTGLDTIDYRFTDAWADPEGTTEHLHTEQLVRLPHGFLCYQPAANCPDVSPLPACKTGHITFGSFNNLPKINAQIVAHWSAILLAVPASRMILKAKPLADVGTQDEIYNLFKQHGVDRDRIDLLGRIPSHPEHLALYNQIDIALDTFPYHGTTTTCEALWMGVPVITLAGQTHVSRVGVSLLASIGFPELIAESAEAYVQTAIALANDLDRLQHLRTVLRDRVQAAPLTNAHLITQSIENAYRKMWQNLCIQESLEPDQRLVEIKSDVKVCVKDDLTSLTTYILLEQGDWFEAEMAFIRHLITPGMQILDIGANH